MSRSLYDHSANDRGERHDWAEHAEDTARHSSSFEGAFGMEERSGDVSSDSRTTWGDRLALHLRGNHVGLDGPTSLKTWPGDQFTVGGNEMRAAEHHLNKRQERSGTSPTCTNQLDGLRLVVR